MSVRYGPPHRPWTANMAPTVAKFRNAMRQKRWSPTIVAKPTVDASFVRHARPGGALRPPTTITIDAMATTPAPQTKTVRQPSSPASQAIGVPASRAPLEPIPTRTPETVANRPGGNQEENAFIAPIRTPAKPIPRRARAKLRTRYDSPRANSNEPNAPTSISDDVTVLEPQRSSAAPSGNCVTAKAR